jgi:hypothetical protein
MVCQRCRGLLVCETFDGLGIESEPLYTTRPHAASIVGVSRMPSFVRIASTVRREREECRTGAGPLRVHIDPVSGRCGSKRSSRNKP